MSPSVCEIEYGTGKSSLFGVNNIPEFTKEITSEVTKVLFFFFFRLLIKKQRGVRILVYRVWIHYIKGA